jgi:hypothetical protein
MELIEALEAEIEFWQGLIERQADDVPEEVVERMAQARMLAERRLSELIGGGGRRGAAQP